jgi:hypothetical protein
MVMAGLARHRCFELARKIALCHLDAVVAVCEDTGTLWENYAPENNSPGEPARKDFVGWTGLVPIAVLFEYVFGLQPNAHAQRIVWHCDLTDEFGIDAYPFGRDGILDLAVKRRCSREERPQLSVTSNVPVSFEIHWGRSVDTWEVRPGAARHWGIDG